MSHENDDKLPIAIPLPELKTLAAEVAAELKSVAGDVPLPLRQRFIEVRAALFQRGIFDPVLVRFDTASAPRASTAEIAEQLETVAQAL